MRGVAVRPGAGQRARVTEIIEVSRHDDGQQSLVLDLAMPGLDEIWTVTVVADAYAILPNGADSLENTESLVLELVLRPVGAEA